MNKVRAYLIAVLGITLVISSVGCTGKLKLADKSYHTGQLEIQFIGNAAFHITDGESTLLIDFPYESGAYGYMEYKLEDVKPVKDGLCLITHSHSDHWDVELFEKMDHAIIVPPEEYVESEKIIPFDDVMAFKDITIQAFKTCHVGRTMEFEHYSYLVTWHGLRLYIFGDAVEDHALTMKDVDIMFLPVWLTGKIKNQELTLDAKTLIVFHQKEGQEIPSSPDYLVLKQGETIKVEFKEK